MRALLAIGCTLGALVSAGCARIVSGTAEFDADAGPTTSLREMLLSTDEVDDVIGTSGMAVVEEFEELTDNAPFLDDTECLGALYHSEQEVYDDTEWREVVDQVLSNEGHWMEQTVVRMASPEEAEAFADQAKIDWTNCIGQRVSVDDDQGLFRWRFEGVAIDDASIAQTVYSDDGGGRWRCRHVLRPEGEVIVEASVCGETLHGEAETIAERIAARAP